MFQSITSDNYVKFGAEKGNEKYKDKRISEDDWRNIIKLLNDKEVTGSLEISSNEMVDSLFEIGESFNNSVVDMAAIAIAIDTNGSRDEYNKLCAVIFLYSFIALYKNNNKNGYYKMIELLKEKMLTFC